MDILWKSVLGGLVTGLIVWLARRGDVVPGIIPLFPTFTLIALTAVGLKGDPRGFQITCVAGLKTIPGYVAFLLVSYLLASKVDFRITLMVALVAWVVVVLAIFILPGLHGKP
jgi:uncharacterized membrane protein (GlpM family)